MMSAHRPRMRSRAASLIVLLLFMGVRAVTQAQDNPPIPPAPTEVQVGGGKTASSVSSTKQFVVHGADLSIRSAFCLLCEETAASLGRLLKDDGKYQIPIVIAVKTPPDVNPQEPAVRPNITLLTHGGFHLQVTAQLRGDFHREDFTREVVRVLLAERILRNQKDVNTERDRAILPDWLLTGVLQAMEFRSRSKPSVLFAAVFKSGQVYSIDRILAADPRSLDAMARGIYEVSSCALVLTLLDQPDGPLRVQKFLAALATDTRADRELLQQHFPTLGASRNSLEKWWTLQLASLATPSAFEAMSAEETEEYLDKALALYYTERVGEEPKELAEGREGRGIFGWLKRDKKPESKPASAPVASLPGPPGSLSPPGTLPSSTMPPPAPTDADLPPLPLPLQPGAKPMSEEPPPGPAAGDAPPSPPPAPGAVPPPDAPSGSMPPPGPAPGPAVENPAPSPAAGPKPEAPDSPPAPAPPAPSPDTPAPEDASAKDKDKPAPPEGGETPKAAPKPKPAPAPAPKKKPATPAKEDKPAEKTVPEKKEDTRPRFKFPKIFGGGKSVAYTLLFIAAAVAEAAPPPPAEDAGAKPPPKSSPAPKKPEAKPEPAPAEEKPSFFRRNRRASSKPEEPAEQKKPAEAPKPAPAPKPKPADPAPKKEETPKDKDKDDEPEGEKKPSKLNPLNWFKKGTPKPEDSDNPPEEKDAPAGRSRKKPESSSREPAAPKSPEPGAPDEEPAPAPKVNPNVVSLDSYQRIWKRSDRTDILQRNLTMLNALHQRAHPLYRPLVEEYTAVVQQLVNGSDKGVAAKLASLAQRRTQLQRRAKAVQSYLDWYEANETQTFSHLFDDYLKLRDRLEKERPPRGDAMSQYLDALEKEYE